MFDSHPKPLNTHPKFPWRWLCISATIAALIGAGCGFYAKGYRFSILQDVGKNLSPEPTIQNESFPPDPDSAQQQSPSTPKTSPQTSQIPEPTIDPAEGPAAPPSTSLSTTEYSDTIPDTEPALPPPISREPGLESSLPLPSDSDLPPPSPLPAPELTDPATSFTDLALPSEAPATASDPALPLPEPAEIETTPER